MPRRLPLIALVALLAAALTAAALLGLAQREADRTDRAREAALTAAVEAAPVIFSYHHAHLERDFAAAREHLTGSFLEEYERTTETVVAPTAAEYRAVVRATVASPPSGDAPAASVVSASPEQVVVLLFINQVSDSTQVDAERVDLNRVRMTLSRTGQGWKVSAVDAL
jgi:Mce-associated membrane protein